MNQRYFVTSSGTGVGKSFITAALVRQARAMGRSVVAYKPVVTGFYAANTDISDTGLLLRSQSLPPANENIERISPWRFTAPLAPSMAARMEQRVIDFDALVMHSRGAALAPEDIILIEGIGGVMVPIDDEHTVIDWIERTEIPAILVAGSYLGSLSHTLTALSVLQQRHIPIHAIIVNESDNAPLPVHDIVEELSRWTRLPIVPVARRKGQSEDDTVPELQGLLA
jgi:dethiobiotin synthetase